PGVAEGRLARDQVWQPRRLRRVRREGPVRRGRREGPVRRARTQRLQLILQPRPVRLLPGEPCLDGLVFLEPAALWIDTQHLPWSQFSPAYPSVATNIDRAGFRGAGDQPVLAHRIAQRSQAVAIERRSDPNSVG